MEGIEIAPEVDAEYDRDAKYGGWRDGEGDCQNTRHVVLAAESLVPVTYGESGRARDVERATAAQSG